MWDFDITESGKTNIQLHLSMGNGYGDGTRIALEMSRGEAKELHQLLAETNPCDDDECRCHAAGVALAAAFIRD